MRKGIYNYSSFLNYFRPYSVKNDVKIATKQKYIIGINQVFEQSLRPQLFYDFITCAASGCRRVYYEVEYILLQSPSVLLIQLLQWSHDFCDHPTQKNLFINISTFTAVYALFTAVYALFTAVYALFTAVYFSTQRKLLNI